MRHQWGYLLLEALRGLLRDKFLSVTSVITLGLCASVFALALASLSLVFSLTPEKASDTVVRVFVRSEKEDEASRAELERRLRALPGIDSVRFIGKEEALEEFRRDFERDIGAEMLKALDMNPLPESFLVYPGERYRPASQNRLLRDRIALFSEVELVTGNSNLSWVDRYALPVKAVSFLLMLFMGGVLTLIVQNSVKLNLYSRRLLVENMKYCGAGEAFIITSFLLEGLLLGLLGSLMGVLFLAFLVSLLSYFSPAAAAEVGFRRCAVFLVLATASIACVASAGTVRGFLRQKGR